MIGLYNLALGPQPGEYIGFSDHDGVSSFLVSLRGVRTIRETKIDATQPSARASPNTARSSTSNDDAEVCVPETFACTTARYSAHLERLRCLARVCPKDFLSSASKDASIYLTAINELEPFFEEIYGTQPQAESCQPRPINPYSRVPFGWLYRISEGFMNRLQEKAPLALAIFACFALVLKKLETGWTVEGWPEHIMSGVWKFLRPESRDLIEWPIQEMVIEPLVAE